MSSTAVHVTTDAARPAGPAAWLASGSTSFAFLLAVAATVAVVVLVRAAVGVLGV